MIKKNKSVKKNFFWQFSIEIINMLLPLITSPLIARKMGAEVIGIYSYVYSITYYFILFSNLGIYQYATREIAYVRDDKEKLNKKFSELLFAQLLIGLFILTLFIIFIFFNKNYKIFFIIEIMNLLGSSVILVNWFFSGLEEFKSIAIKTIIIRIIGALLIIVCIKSPKDIYLYFMIMAAEPLCSALIYIILIKNRVKIVKVKLRDVFSHFKGMIILFIPILTTYVYNSMDKIMLGKYSVMCELGYYENATKALIAKNLAVVLSTVLIPRVSNLISNNEKEKFNIIFTKTINVVFLLEIIFGFGTASVSNIFSIVFWGKEFVKCGNLILIMSLTMPALGITYVINNQYLIPCKKEKVYIKATIIGVIINLFLNLLLIKKYHAYGAAIATLITEYIVMIIECYEIRKDYSIFINLKSSYIYILFGLIMFGSVRFIGSFLENNFVNLFIEILLGGMFIFILLISYWVLTKNTEWLNLIKEILNEIRINKKKNEKNFNSN